MKSSNNSTFSCRFCQHYEMEGRRGGSCRTLNVPVQGNWEACPFAIRSFIQAPVPVAEIIDESNMSVSDEKILSFKKSDRLTGKPSSRKVS